MDPSPSTPGLARDRRALLSALALGVLGLSGVVGEVAGLDGLRPLTEGLAAAPLPGSSPWSRPPLDLLGSRLFVVFADERPPVELDAEHFDRLRGSGPRRALYRLSLARGPALDVDPRRCERFRALLARAFEPGSELRAELGLEALAPIAALQWQSADAADSPETYAVELRGQ